MRIRTLFILSVVTLLSCEPPKENNKIQPKAQVPIVGTWKLVKGIVMDKKDTVVTDYTKAVSFIKIINNSHFAFLQHDLEKGKGKTASFAAGGGSYSLTDSVYKERLEYCSDRAWEANDFSFVVTVSNDTLVQKGVEKIEKEGIDRVNIEKYVRVK
jgi:hypothetical protein